MAGFRRQGRVAGQRWLSHDRGSGTGSSAHMGCMKELPITPSARVPLVERAGRRLEVLADAPSTNLAWGVDASFTLAVYGLCLLTADTLSYVQRKGQRR